MRPWKYDASIMQHWVETGSSGTLIHNEAEREVHEEQAPDAPPPVLNLDFQDGPGPGPDGGQGGQAIAVGFGEVGRPDDQMGQVSRPQLLGCMQSLL